MALGSVVLAYSLYTALTMPSLMWLILVVLTLLVGSASAACVIFLQFGDISYYAIGLVIPSVLLSIHSVAAGMLQWNIPARPRE